MNDIGRTIINEINKEEKHAKFAPYIPIYKIREIINRYDRRVDMVLNVMIDKKLLYLSKSGKAAKLCNGLRNDFLPSTARSYHDFDVFCERRIYDIQEIIESIGNKGTLLEKVNFIAKYYFNGLKVSEKANDSSWYKHFSSQEYTNWVIECDLELSMRMISSFAGGRDHEIVKTRDIINGHYRTACETYSSWYRDNYKRLLSKQQLKELEEQDARTRAELEKMRAEREEYEKQQREKRDREMKELTDRKDKLNSLAIIHGEYCGFIAKRYHMFFNDVVKSGKYSVTYNQTKTYEMQKRDLVDYGRKTEKTFTVFFETKEAADKFKKNIDNIHINRYEVYCMDELGYELSEDRDEDEMLLDQVNSDIEDMQTEVYLKSYKYNVISIDKAIAA